MKPIMEIAEKLGLTSRDLLPFGEWKAKVRLDVSQRVRPQGKLILVSAISPTPKGEGKTTMTIGLGQALAKMGQSVCLALREPSLGPCFGIKGGGTGGGRSQVVPMEDINLHFTGDFHAITSAHNLLSAVIDNWIFHKGTTDLDPRQILWKRVMDMNDRALRNITIGLGGPRQGVPRESGFDITAASEIMSILCLSESYEEMKTRLNNILVGFSRGGEPVTANMFHCSGAMVALLKDAFLPNLVQTIEGVPAMLHGGPFANIAHGCNSVLATKTALRLADWVVTEAGFGFDLGGEKFFDIKCQSAGLDTAAVVLVATCRALKFHGGVSIDQLDTPDPESVQKGLGNLDRQVGNIRQFKESPIVCLNHHDGDSEEEIEVIRQHCEDQLKVPFGVCRAYSEGGEGGLELAQLVMQHAEQTPQPFCPLYDWKEEVPEKIRKIAQNMYGASHVEYTKKAQRDLKTIRALGYQNFPICIAKTPASFTDDPQQVGHDKEFFITVRDIVIAAGAGFLVPITGEILRMPGLPSHPQAENLDFVDGEISGLR